MNIRLGLEKELSTFGRNITVTTEQGSGIIRGIIMPLLYKNKIYISGKRLPEGYFDSGHYLLICESSVKLPVTGTAFFECDQKRYVLKRSESVGYMDKPLYIWAVLETYHSERDDEFEA